jgi:hypothetical protein
MRQEILTTKDLPRPYSRNQKVIGHQSSGKTWSEKPEVANLLLSDDR